MRYLSLCETLGCRLRGDGVKIKTIAVSITYWDFTRIGHQRQLYSETDITQGSILRLGGCSMKCGMADLSGRLVFIHQRCQEQRRGRYYISESDQAEIQKILRKIDAQNQAGKYRTGEVFPTNIATVITNDEKLKLFSWGFPKWQAKGVIINARSETAATKPIFSKALRERRCAIPSSGFFEW